MKSISESIGMVIPSKEHGNVKVVGVKERKDWGSTVVVYLDRVHMNNIIGRHWFEADLTGGALIVEKTTDPVTTFENFPN